MNPVWKLAGENSFAGGFGRLSGSLLVLFGKSLKGRGELLDGSLKRTDELCKKGFLGRNLGEGLYAVGVIELGPDESRLEDEVFVVLGVFSENPRGSGFVVGNGKSRCPRKNLGKAVEPGVLHGESEKSVLLDGVFNARLAELLAKLCVVLDGDAGIVYELLSISVISATFCFFRLRMLSFGTDFHHL